MTHTIDPIYAYGLIDQGVSLTAFQIHDDGRRIPWAKGWSKSPQLPITTREAVDSCIRSGCHGFQFRAIDAGYMVIDIDRKGGKDGLQSLKQAAMLHSVNIPGDLVTSGYIVQTPNDGYHVYLRPDEWLSTQSLKGIIDGIDILCDRSSLVIVPGSVGVNKTTGQMVPYKAMGNLSNVPPIPQPLAGMFRRIHDAREQQKEEKRRQREAEILERQKRRSERYEAGTIFAEAKNRITPSVITSLFAAGDYEWRVGRNGRELWTLNPMRDDKTVGSFSIREDGVYHDMAQDGQSGDFIDLISRTYNMSPLDAARLIIRETGGDPAHYEGRPKDSTKGVTITIGDKSVTITDDYTEDETPKDSQPKQPQAKVIDRALFPLQRLSELSLEEDEWLVDRLFQADSLALVYGKPGVGKSFWVLDVALSIATGKSFNGHITKGGPVIYLAGEGRKGILKRSIAWGMHHGVDVANSPFFLAGRPFDLIDASSVGAVLEAVDYHTHGIAPKVVVIDTLARNFGVGDENKTSDMGAVIRNADIIRTKYNCLVVIVHHSGHGEGDRARGSSSLKAAMDFEYNVSQDEQSEILTVKNTRMKDGQRPKDMHYKLEDVDLGRSYSWGEAMTSAVLIPQSLEKKPHEAPMGKKQKETLRMIENAIDEKRRSNHARGEYSEPVGLTNKEYSERCRLAGMDKSNAYNLKKSLIERKKIVEDSDTLYVVQEAIGL